jgi:dolichyl-phosphate-mannose--protein O-mannosyl transferase
MNEKISSIALIKKRLPIILILFGSILLRFSGLSNFNELVFDETFYAKYAVYYLNSISFFHDHPPLTKYLIALGIWLSEFNPFGYSTITNFENFQLATVSYRWLNAFIGSLIPLLVYGIVYKISYSRTYAIIASLFVALDGLLLVESRYALSNIYIIFWGLLGHYLFLIALEKKALQKQFILGCAGISLGFCASIKWNGLGFLLGIYLYYIISSFFGIKSSLPKPIFFPLLKFSKISTVSQEICLKYITNLRWQELIGWLGIVPVIIYWLLWIPHLKMIPDFTFWQIHKESFIFHDQLSSNAHPYCSKWYSWILMIRPVGYLYKEKIIETDSAQTLKTVIYDVHGMGNPVLWWLSAIAIMFLLFILIIQVKQWLMSKQNQVFQVQIVYLESKDLWIVYYLVINFLANWLPWAGVHSCLFIYHYMPASIFAFLGLAFLTNRWLFSGNLLLRITAIMTIASIIFAFIYWLPLYLGLPLSPNDFQSRMWLNSWY